MPATSSHRPTTDADVAIVGLGPVGATVAALLAAHGVSSIALERSPAPTPLPRAVALDDESLRILQAAGLNLSGEPELLVGPGVTLRGRAGRLLLELPPSPARFGHPTLAFVHQPDLEAALRRRLVPEPLVQLRLGAAVTAITSREQSVSVRLAGGDTLTVAYALGCDGAGGITRRGLGIGLRGWTSPRRWLVIDGRPSATASVRAPFTFHAEPRRPSVDGPIPGGRHRWEFMLAAHEDPRAMVAPGRVSELLRAAGAGEVRIERAAVYTFHARVASRWREERVFLMGDAAHLSPPFAGQGLGAGLRDAGNLAWKLAAVLHGGAEDALLDSYDRERRGHVTRMNALAVGLGAAVQTRAPVLAEMRDTAVSALARVPAVSGWARRGGWKPPPRYRRGLVASAGEDPSGRLRGRLMPQPWVREQTGRRVLLDDLLGPGFALVGLEVPVRAPGPDTRLPMRAVSLRRAGGQPSDASELQVLDDALDDWWNLAAQRVLVLRPDRYVYAVAQSQGVPSALIELSRALGLKPRAEDDGSPGARPGWPAARRGG